MSASYKPALLKGLVRLIRRGAGTKISLQAIGREFVAMYWTQTVVFRMRQAASLAKEPEVVQRIREAALQYRVRSVHDLPEDARTRLDIRMAKILPINVLRAFHVGKPALMSDLYAWNKGDEFVTLTVEAHQFLREHSTAVESIANYWWARYLERVNLLAPLIIDKVERDGAKRGSLTRYLQILREIDGTRCFYCERDLGAVPIAHVDHVIPWSFLLADPMWDLVLACAACNLAKSDTLPARVFLEKLNVLHHARAQRSIPAGIASMSLRSEEIDRYYDAALSVEWPSGWKPPPSLHTA